MKRVGWAILVLPLLVALTSVVFANDLTLNATDLIAGGGNENSATLVGSVRVMNHEDMGTGVRYLLKEELRGKYCLTEVHLHVFQDIADVPQNKGGPIPGQFKYKYEFDDCEWVVYVPIDEPVEDGTYFIAAHAVVRETGECDCDDTCWEETAWGGCWFDFSLPFPGANWAMYFPATVSE
jgi:hypothetical protein